MLLGTVCWCIYIDMKNTKPALPFNEAVNGLIISNMDKQDCQIAALLDASVSQIRRRRKRLGLAKYVQGVSRRKPYADNLCNICRTSEVPASRLHNRPTHRICNQCRSQRNAERGYSKSFYHRHRQRLLSERNEEYKQNKQQVFEHYGNACVYCGASENLQIDHINGDRKAEAEKRGYELSGTGFYRKVIKDGFPNNLQTTCRQCNIAKQDMTDAEYRAWIKHCYHFLS